VKTAVADRVFDSSVHSALARKRGPAMDTTAQDHSGSDTTQEVANLGVVRPPLVYGASIVTGLLLAFGWPLPFLPRRLAALLGSVLVVVAVVVFAYAIRTFQTAGTPVPGNKPTTVLVRTGPYRCSRNPIYVAFSLFQLGIASWVNSVWLIATLIAAVALMAAVVIPREERYLARRFGADYVEYKRAVRRWL
jgi:protein-S-isoprenylcysteine O-methyltransferase Ste14